MSFKPGDKVCFSPDIFEGSKSELIAKHGTGTITSEEYIDLRPYPHLPLRPPLHIRIRLHSRPRLRPRLGFRIRFISIKWESIEEECWEYVDCLCLVEEREERDIYKLFERMMNK